VSEATRTPARAIDGIVERGEIGGRTVQIVESGAVECAVYEPAPLPAGHVRVRTVRSAISPGTEMTFFGKDASNVYLHKQWNEDLRLFEPGRPSMEYPIVFGYRAAGEVSESRAADVAVGQRVFGNWRHTEWSTMPGQRAIEQALPDDLSWEDGVDIAQMGPICVNAVLFAEGEQVAATVVVFGAGPVGLITAQVARASGAERVYVVDRLASRLAIADSLGLTPVEAADGVDVAAVLKRRHGSEGIPLAIECTGSTFALHEAIRVVKRRGLVVGAGFYQAEGRGLMLGEEFHHNGVRISCGQIGNVHPSTDWGGLRARTIELVRSGQVVLGGLPRTTVPVERVAEGFEALTRPGDTLQVALSYEVSV
jgi:threonine dehydrogenase-like Zn-dependent dehydrogenase